MSMARPSNATLIIAALASLALLLVSGIAVWRHFSSVGGDDLATRSAVVVPVDEAITAASNHSDSCIEGLSKLVRASSSALNVALAEFDNCGKVARQLAERGYSTLDAAAGSAEAASSAGRDAYLDAAGSLFSVYEMQGDDFDMIFDMLSRANGSGTAIATLQGEITAILDTSAPDIQTGQKELARARDAYRSKG